MKDESKKYFKGELNEHEAFKFEKRLYDKMMRGKYEQFLESKGLYNPPIPPPPKESILTVIWRNCNQYYDQLHTQYRTQSLAAASILLVLGFTWFLWTKPPLQTDWATIIDKEMQVKFEPPFTRMSSAESLKEWKMAKQAYQQGKFEDAAQNMALIEKNQEATDTTLFYYALCRFYQTTPNYTEATQYFEKIVAKNQNFKTESLWFLTLIHLKNGDIKKGKTTLEQFRTIQSTYKQKQSDALWHELQNK